jgi:hypothetical protein
MAARERQRDKQQGVVTRRLSWPAVVLAGGVLLSLAANLAQAQPTAWGRVVAAVPSAAFLVAVSMIERRAARRPRPAAGEDGAAVEPSAPGRPSPVPDTGDEPRDAGDEALLSAARRAASEHQDRHGQPITRDALRARVAEFSAADKYEDFTRAVNALDEALGLSRPGATRILVIVSDGRYKGTQHADGQKLITRLAASGCLVIWIAPSDTANTMTGARVVILADPAAASAAVARAVAASARTA